MGDSGKFATTALALGQIGGHGKLRAQERNQLINSGVPIFDLLGQKLNKSSKELMEMMSAGNITSSMVYDVLSDSVDKGRYKGLLEEMRGTVFGKWQEFIGGIKADIGSKGQGKTTDALKSAIESLKELWKVLPDFTKAFTFFIKMFTKAVNFVKDNASWLKWVAGFLGGRWLLNKIAPIFTSIIGGTVGIFNYRKSVLRQRKAIRGYDRQINKNKEWLSGMFMEGIHNHGKFKETEGRVEYDKTLKKEKEGLQKKYMVNLRKGWNTLLTGLLGRNVFSFLKEIFTSFKRLATLLSTTVLRNFTVLGAVVLGVILAFKGINSLLNYILDKKKGDWEKKYGKNYNEELDKLKTQIEFKRAGETHTRLFTGRFSGVHIPHTTKLMIRKNDTSGIDILENPYFDGYMNLYKNLRWYPSFADKGFPAFSTLEEANLKTGGEGTKTTEDIITGGRRQTILNVSIGTVGQFEEVNVNGGDEAATDIGDKIYKALFEAIGGSTRNLASTV